jgi:hypothetical protein
MRVRAEPVWIPKRGNDEGEYEDACWPDQLWEAESSCLRFAVADGASESCFARRWARTLVEAAGDGRLEPGNFEGGLATLQDQWQEWLAGQNLAWYVEEKAQQGSFAALVLLLLKDNSQEIGRGGEWQALALGDSCLIQVRGERLLERFPIAQSMEFNNRPHLLGSRPGSLAGAVQRLKDAAGKWEPGDTFYLITDALACWFLREAEAGGKPWEALDAAMVVDDRFTFRRWVDDRRSQGRLRNDDCTVLRLAIE